MLIINKALFFLFYLRLSTDQDTSRRISRALFLFCIRYEKKKKIKRPNASQNCVFQSETGANDRINGCYYGRQTASRGNNGRRIESRTFALVSLSPSIECATCDFIQTRTNSLFKKLGIPNCSKDCNFWTVFITLHKILFNGKV